MEYSSIDREAVFLNEDCRQAFGQPQYTSLTKKRDIRNIIREWAISVENFTENKLVAILYYLIGEGVFLAAASIERQFPDLYKPNLASNSSHEQSPVNSWLEGYDDLVILYFILTSC